MAHVFTAAELFAVKMYRGNLVEIRRFGGVENTPAGWAAYAHAVPERWYLPVVAAWLLHRAGKVNCPDLPWRIAQIALRDQPEANQRLREWRGPLNDSTWRHAYRLAQQLAGGARQDHELLAVNAAYALYCAYDAAKEHSPDGFAADAIKWAAKYAAGIAGAKHEIIAIAAGAMASMN